MRYRMSRVAAHRARGRRRRWAALASLAFLLLAAGLSAFYWSGERARRARPSAPPPEDRRGEAVAEAVTGPQTVIVFRTAYTGCSQEVTRTEMAGAALAGLHRQELARRFPGWEVALFRPGQVLLRQVRPGPCPEGIGDRTITVRDGRVVVFAGRPPRLGELLWDTGIKVESLLPADREKLDRGLVVHGDTEVWRVLEGLGDAQ